MKEYMKDLVYKENPWIKRGFKTNQKRGKLKCQSRAKLRRKESQPV